MKWAIYNLLFAAVYPFLLPGFLLRMLRRGGYAARFNDRFALYPEAVIDAFRAREGVKAPVWIHAVSVGEVQVAGQLMREWRSVEPEVRFCFSTTSSTGWKMAEKEVNPACGDILIYNPLDFPNFVKSALKTVKPRAIVLTESEIWPNFILKAKKYKVPLFLINARVSDRSAPRYRMAKCFFGDVLSAFTKIFAQSDLDRERLLAAGAPAEKVEVTGSFKFDVAHRNLAKEVEMRTWLGEGGKILLGGSTWPGEDKVLLEIYKELVNLNSGAMGSSRLTEEAKSPRLVIAPRHFEKADEVEANIKAAGFTCKRRSRGDREGEVALADTTGELMGLYGIADVVFVGKSLCAHGSQNMIEPCLCGKPTFVGPYTENFRPVMSDLLASEAIIQVNDAEELKAGILKYFRGDEELAKVSERAKAAVEKRCGVVKRCVAAILIALAGCSRETELPKTTMAEAVSNAIETIAATFAPSGDVRRVNTSGMTVAAFYERIKDVSPRATLWMPGATDWVIVGTHGAGFTSLAASIDRLFALETKYSLPELFSSYVGTIEEVLPALQNLDWQNEVKPWNFVQKDIPELIWLKTDGIDDDIRRSTLAEIRSMQVVRRIVLEGSLLSASGKKEDAEKAVEEWGKAALRSPHDSMILERLERLDRNAKGFLEVGKLLQAMKCYETMLLIQPKHAAAVHNFGMCLKKLGKLDMAEQVLKRAEVLEKQYESND